MDNSQTNENELQKAIDDITKNSTPTTSDVVSELESKIQNQMGVPPVPPMPAVGEVPAGMGALPPMMEAPAVTLEVSEMAIPAVEPAVETVVAPVMSEVSAVGAEMVAGPDDLEKVKEEMLRDLIPIMDRINIMPEQKYKIYKQMLGKTGDKSVIAKAYEAVKSITDEAARAEALLYLLEKAE